MYNQAENHQCKFSELIPCFCPYRLETATVRESRNIIHGYCMVPDSLRGTFTPVITSDNNKLRDLLSGLNIPFMLMTLKNLHHVLAPNCSCQYLTLYSKLFYWYLTHNSSCDGLVTHLPAGVPFLYYLVCYSIAPSSRGCGLCPVSQRLEILALHCPSFPFLQPVP